MKENNVEVSTDNNEVLEELFGFEPMELQAEADEAATGSDSCC
jgi:hypothetical protein